MLTNQPKHQCCWETRDLGRKRQESQAPGHVLESSTLPGLGSCVPLPASHTLTWLPTASRPAQPLLSAGQGWAPGSTQPPQGHGGCGGGTQKHFFCKIYLHLTSLISHFSLLFLIKKRAHFMVEICIFWSLNHLAY